MRKLILLFAFMCTTLISFSQTSDGNLEFMGAQLGNTTNEMLNKLKQKGLKYGGISANTTYLTGTFSGYKDCTIYILSTGDVTHSVGVWFPYYETWALLSSNYYMIKNQLIAKYGNPATTKETFQTDLDSQPSDDQTKMQYLNEGKCHYTTEFDVHNGIIELSIVHTTDIRGKDVYNVRLVYSIPTIGDSNIIDTTKSDV